MTTMRGAPEGGAATARERRASPRMIAAVVLAIVLTLFAVLNAQGVRVHLIVTTTRLPVIVVIAVSGLIGVAVGWLIARRRGGRGAAP